MDIHILDSRKNVKHQFYFINMPEVILSLASLFKFIFQFKTYLSPPPAKNSHFYPVTYELLKFKCFAMV